MRLLLTCLPYYSHLVPALLPVAEAARRAGHAVAVATAPAPAMADRIAQAGVEHLPLPNVPTLAELLADPDFAGSPGMPGAKAESEEDGARARARPGRLSSSHSPQRFRRFDRGSACSPAIGAPSALGSQSAVQALASRTAR